MAIADGTYEMLPMLDVTMAVDVQGNSVANSATVFLWSRNGGNSQKWTFRNEGSYYTIKDAETGKALDVYGGKQQRGQRCIMYTYGGRANQHWKVTEVGTQAVNGTEYPVVTIGAFAGTTYLMDCTGNKSAMRTILEIWTASGAANQQFVLVPTEWEATASANTSYAALPTPSRGTSGATVGTALPSSAGLANGTLHPAWACSQERYQVRYRTRTRAAGTDGMGAWSNWKSIADGSTAWDGWGAPGASNCTPTVAGGLRWSTDGVPVDNRTTYDRTDVQFSARAWSASWGAGGAAHGASYAWTVTTTRPVTISDASVLLSPDGVTVAWASTATGSGNAVTLESDVWGTYTTTGAGTGSATVPQYAMRRTPDEGETVSVKVTLRTADGVTVSRAVSATATYEGQHGTTLELHADVDGTLATITASNANARAWLVVPEGHGTRYVPLAGSSPWVVPAPLGVAWQVLASIVNGTSWASVLQRFPAIYDTGWHVTSQDMTKDLAVYVNAGSAPKADVSYSRSVDAVDVIGRERPVYLPSDATEASWTLDGMTYGDYMAEDAALADWAVHAGHVYFRGPNGFWAQACVTGGKVEQSTANAREISISMSGEVW